MIRTEQPVKYDPYVKANVTLENYILTSLGGLPNASLLEEQWNELPDAKKDAPLRCIAGCRGFEPSRPQRFYMNRLTDVTGVSGTGRVLNGVIMPTGKVVFEWTSEPCQIGFYDSFEKFLSVHVDKHPDANEVVFID